MATTIRNLVPAKYAENTQTAQYTAVDLVAVIDTFTVTNTSASNVSFSINIVPSGGSVSNSNLIFDSITIGVGETYNCPELVGKVLQPGSFLSTLASAASSLTIDVTGREIT